MEGTSAKTLTIAAIIGSVIIWVLWLGIGSSVAAPTPTMQLSVVEHSPISLSASELGAEESSTEQTFPRRVKTEPVSHLSDDFSDTALVGTVFDPDGQLVPDAVVALVVASPNGPTGKPMAHVRTAWDGVFVLDPPIAMRDRDLMLIARRVGFRPACIPFRIDTTVRQQELVLRLERGHSIQGRVVRDGQPVGGARVDVDLRWMATGVHGIGREAFWIGDRLLI